MLRIFITIIFALALAFPTLGYGQVRSLSPEGTTLDTRQVIKEEFREDFSGAREELQQNIQETKDEFRTEASDLRTTLSTEAGTGVLTPEQITEFRKRREEALRLFQDRREEFQRNIKTIRADFRTRVEEKRAELKVRLQEVRDERKKQVTEKVYDRFHALNERLTNHFSAVLAQIEEVLERIESRADKAEANGLNVIIVMTAITDARNAIDGARQGVEVQAGNVYSIEVTGEEGLKAVVKATRDSLRNDLVTLRSDVFSVRDAVREAAVALAQIPRVDEVEVEDMEEPEDENGEDDDGTSTTTEQ